MEIILLEKVHKLGELGDRVNVKPGYGRNYLIPSGKAVSATKDNIAKFDARRAELEKQQQEAVAEAFSQAHRFGPVLIERFMNGLEVTAAVLADTVLPLVSMKASGEFYDYHAKYLAEDTEYVCPARLDDELTRTIQDMAMTVFTALDCRGWARVDFMLNEQGEPNFIECNTAPGMTSHSLVPIAAREVGLNFDALCVQILASTLSTEDISQ